MARRLKVRDSSGRVIGTISRRKHQDFLKRSSKAKSRARRAEDERLGIIRDSKGKIITVKPTSPERAAEMRAKEVKQARADFKRAISRGDIKTNVFGNIEPVTKKGRSVLSLVSDIDRRTVELAEKAAQKQTAQLQTEEVKAVQKVQMAGTQEGKNTLRSIDNAETRAAPVRFGDVKPSPGHIPKFQETVPQRDIVSQKSIDTIISKNIVVPPLSVREVVKDVKPARVVFSTGGAVVLSPLSEDKGAKFFDKLGQTHSDKPLAVQVSKAGAFTVGVSQGSLEVVRDTVKSGGSNLLIGTIDLIVKPGESIAQVAKELSKGPIGAGRIVGQLGASGLISARVVKGTAKTVNTVNVIRHDIKTRIPKDQLGPDFQDVTRLVEQPGQTQLIPKNFDTALEIGKAKKTFLGEKTIENRFNRLESDALTQIAPFTQKQVLPKNVETILLESGKFESRITPNEASLRFNLLRGGLFKESLLKTDTQLTLPKGSLEGLDITVIVPGKKAFVSSSSSGFFAGKKGQARTVPLFEPSFSVARSDLSRPARFFSSEAAPVGFGPGKFKSFRPSDLVAPGVKSVQEQPFKFTSNFKINSDSKSSSRISQKELQNLDSLQEVTSKLIIDDKVIQNNKIIDEVVQREKQTPKEEQIIERTFIPSLEQESFIDSVPELQIETPKVTPRPQTTFKPPTIKPKVFDLSFSDSSTKVFNNDFSVFVREKGFFKSIGSNLTSGEAISLGSNVARRSSVASFKVLKGGRPFEVSSFNSILKGQFRPSKSERGVLVEKSSFRIDSPGELEEITFKGLAALKFKGGLL